MCNAEDTASCNELERCCVECRCDLDESIRVTSPTARQPVGRGLTAIVVASSE